jgi:hypothetical protein
MIQRVPGHSYRYFSARARHVEFACTGSGVPGSVVALMGGPEQLAAAEMRLLKGRS